MKTTKSPDIADTDGAAMNALHETAGPKDWGQVLTFFIVANFLAVALSIGWGALVGYIGDELDIIEACHVLYNWIVYGSIAGVVGTVLSVLTSVVLIATHRLRIRLHLFTVFITLSLFLAWFVIQA